MANLFKAPKAPDPYKVAAAQTATNKETAITQSELNQINQVTPDGSLTYSQSGKTEAGNPIWTATQTLSPNGQIIKNQQDQFDIGANQTALDQLGRVQEKLATPFKLDNAASEARIYELGSKRLDPRFAQQEQQLEQSLMDRGIRPGSAGYEALQRQAYEAKNDAYNQLLLNARQQANSELIQERQQPINEMTALMNGQQLATPNYVNTPQTQMANTDLAGMIYRNYDNKVASQNAALGGLFGLGGALIGGGARMYTGR